MRRKIAGFARVDILATIVALSVIAFCAVPACGMRQRATRSMLCLANMRQLTTAWNQYAAEHDGKLVQNFDGAAAIGGQGLPPGAAPWAIGWVDWTTAPNNTNYTLLSGFSRLTPYLPANSNIFRCPSDNYASPAQQKRGWSGRVRSYSMNGTVGAITDSGPFDPIYHLARKISDLVIPGPTETFVFLEEHPDSINDPVFFPPSRSWIDLPAAFHQGACSFGFGDGHAELHHWLGSARRLPVRFNFLPPNTPPNDPDIHFVSYHSSRVSTRSY